MHQCWFVLRVQKCLDPALVNNYMSTELSASASDKFVFRVDNFYSRETYFQDIHISVISD